MCGVLDHVPRVSTGAAWYQGPSTEDSADRATALPASGACLMGTPWYRKADAATHTSSEAMRTIDLDEYGRGYPRPQMMRPEWISLNGRWEFSLDPDQRCHGPAEVRWDRTITVPFSPETVASGIEEPAFFRSCWYRRRVPTPPVPERGHLLLHFGAVDYEATVWIDGRLGGSHRGGYTPFTLDITDAAYRAPAGELEIVVRALDDPQDLAKPRGKQDWCLKPHSIWYPRTTGIWQTVWMETVK